MATKELNNQFSKSTETESEVSQTVDLNKLFGVDVSNDPGLAQSFGQAMIDEILDRTEDNVGVNGRPLKDYSEEYIDSKTFKRRFKSPGDVNMKLRGTMLGTLTVKDDGGGKVTIGWNDSTENAKAYNHHTGDTLPRRPFFGVNQSELRNLREEFKPDISVIKERSAPKPTRQMLDLVRTGKPSSKTLDVFSIFERLRRRGD